MSGLAIQPHSRRVSAFAVAGLMLVAAGSFTAGLTRQIAPGGAVPFPQGQAGSQAYAAIPDATPAPEMQLATAPAPQRKAAPDLTAAVADLPQATAPETSSAPETVSAHDAAATAPDPAPAPSPAPAEDPPTA